MTPAARVQAAIEIIDEIIVSTTSDGPPADVIVARYFKKRRYAGSKDRRAVRELVFSAVRRSPEAPQSGRSAILGLAKDVPGLLQLFGGAPRGPVALGQDEASASSGILPGWIESELSSLVGPNEWAALLERAPLDLRVNVSRASRVEMLKQFEGARPTPFSPWGIRLPTNSRVEGHPAFEAGLVEVQDEGSQLIVLACNLQGRAEVVDLCAGAGGKALALFAIDPDAHILATDSNRLRLSRLGPRARRAAASIETRLIDPPRELEQLEDRVGDTDLVLVDAPCSGSGTWRRNPEARWRLTVERLDKLLEMQRRLLEIGAALVKPGGCLVYAVCSILSREGAGQIARFLEDRSSWIREQTFNAGGRPDGDGRLLTPGHDGTDGFFVARLRRP